MKPEAQSTGRGKDRKRYIRMLNIGYYDFIRLSTCEHKLTFELWCLLRSGLGSKRHFASTYTTVLITFCF